MPQDAETRAALEESLRSGLLFGNADEPLDAYGKRIVRVIVSRLQPAASSEATPPPVAPAPVAGEPAATYTMPKDGWVCFHCGERFTTVGGARDHFGATPESTAGCLIDRVAVEKGGEPHRGRGLLMALRKAEEQLASAQQERDVAVRWIGDLRQERDSAQAQIAELTARAEQAEADLRLDRALKRDKLIEEMAGNLEAARSALADAQATIAAMQRAVFDLAIGWRRHLGPAGGSSDANLGRAAQPSAAETTETPR